MIKVLLVIGTIFLSSGFLLAQHSINMRPASTGNSGSGSNYDVKFYRCEWTIDPRTMNSGRGTIGGTVTTWFETTQNNVSAITIDLNNTSFNNGNLVVKYHGTTCTKSFTGNVLNITLPATIANSGTLDSVSITYSGTTPAVTGAAQGYQVAKDGGGQYYVNTLSESYEDRDWWPCKADMQDKADSMTMIFTVPWNTATKDTFWVAANGVLISSPIVGNNRIFTFKTKYPIASYLVGISVARFNRYYHTVNIGGTSVPAEYDLLAGKSTTYYTNAVAAMNKIDNVIVALSQKFGDYPFKKEKYGFYDGLLGADGMEHQTFSCISSSALNSTGTLTHELMHQWFGDKVTFATWNNLWLAEGFARYSEALGPELVPAIGGNPETIRSGWKSSANGAVKDVGAYIPNSSMTNSNLIWNSHYGTSVYNRGGMVVSMLRTLLGDEKFFQACREYLDDPNLAYGSATTEDLQAHMESVIGGFDLTGFFQSFVYGNGWPTYTGGNAIQWQAVGTDRIRFGIYGQGKGYSGTTVGYYSAVIPLRVQGAGGKKALIVLYDQGNAGVSVGGDGVTPSNGSRTPEVYLGFTPTSVSFDPDNMSLATGANPVNATVLATTIKSFEVKNQNGQNNAIVELADYANVSSVAIEQSSDGTNFHSAGIMKKIGNGVYTFTEPSPGSINYYRARVELQTGNALYSVIVRIESESLNTEPSLLGNPVANELRIRIPQSNNRITYSIIDASGKSIMTGSNNTGDNILKLGVSTLSKGTYFIHLQADNWQKSLPFLKN